MFRIGLKFPCNGLNRVRQHGCPRLYLTARFYETRARAKYEPNGRSCRDAKLLPRYSRANYSDNAPTGFQRPKGGTGARILKTVTITTIAILAYTKYDPDFRATLEQLFPGTDKVLRIIFLEDYFSAWSSSFTKLKNSILGSIPGVGSEEKPGQITQTSFDTPKVEAPKSSKPAIVPLVEKKELAEKPNNEHSKEIRVSKEDKKPNKVVENESATPASPPAKHVPEKSLPTNIVELEKSCGSFAVKAVSGYEEALRVLQNYNQFVITVMEPTGTTVDKGVWQKLKDATERRKAVEEEVEKQSSEALDSLKRLANMINEKRFDTAPSTIDAAMANVNKMISDVHTAKKKYEDTLKTMNVTEQYWKQVKAARQAFNEELQILFPDMNIEEKKIPLSEEAFDLFVLHMFNRINNLQNELQKAKTLEEFKLQSALRKSEGTTPHQELDTLVEIRVSNEKKSLEEQFSKKLLAEQKKFRDMLREQLKLQSQIHTDHLREVLAVKEREYQRQLSRAVSEQSMNDQAKHDMQLATVVGRIRALEATLKSLLEEESEATNMQILWSSCQALIRALKHGPPGVSPDEAVKPLEPMIKAISKAAPKDDPLVHAAINGIPEVANKRGVFPESALRQRFLKVENVARRLAMVPEEGASLPIYLLSYIQSLLVINSGYSIPKSELQNAPIDVDSLNTYEILNRARYWVDQGDFTMSLRYMNLLKGAPRSIAREWMNEVKILLETQQAVNIFNAYAGALGLLFMGADASQPTAK